MNVCTQKNRNIEGINQSHVLYTFPVPKALISLGRDTVNKTDHYKIHEVQDSYGRSLSSWRAMLLFFPPRLLSLARFYLPQQIYTLSGLDARKGQICIRTIRKKI